MIVVRPGLPVVTKTTYSSGRAVVEAVRIKKAINYGIVVHKKEKEMKVNSLNIFVQDELYTGSKGQ